MRVQFMKMIKGSGKHKMVGTQRLLQCIPKPFFCECTWSNRFLCMILLSLVLQIPTWWKVKRSYYWSMQKSCIPCTSQALNNQHDSQNSYCSSGSWTQKPNPLSRRWSPCPPHVFVIRIGAQMSWTAVTLIHQLNAPTILTWEAIPYPPSCSFIKQFNVLYFH
jgi:hypothetical protein